MQPLSSAVAPVPPRFWSRIGPALLLVVLAPVIAEFLLGDFSVRQAYVLVILLPLYGGGALLIREVTRRSGRGWPTIILLAIAYGIFEEGITTMSLFNADYAGAHLLSYGFIPWLGTSFAWDVFVVSIHAVFSIATPILIAEGVAGPRRTEPWLRTPGLVLAIAMVTLGALINTTFQIATSHFVASPAQLVAVVVLVVGLIVAAFAVFPRREPKAAEPGSWRAWLAAPVVLVLLSALMGVRYGLPGRGVAAAWVILLMLLALAALGAVVLAGSRRRGWAPMGCLAVAAGAVGTYAWVSLAAFLQGHTNLQAPTGPADVVAQIVLVLLVFGLIALGAVRSRPGHLAARPEPVVAQEARAG